MLNPSLGSETVRRPNPIAEVFGAPEVWLLTVAAAAVTLLAPLNTDSGWYLLAARRLLEGDRLYVDLVDVNPPLIFWIMFVPAGIGAGTGLGDSEAIGVFVGLMLFLVVWLALRVMQTAPAMPRGLRFTILLGFLASLVPLYAFQVGQREQLATLLLLPYLALAAATIEGRRPSGSTAVTCGIAAGLAVALKPFFLAPWLAVELVVIVVLRSVGPLLRAESVIVALTQVLYLAVVVIVVPEYISDVVPVARSTYHAYGGDWRTLLEATWTYGLTAIGLLGIAMRFLLSGTHAAIAAVSGAAAIGFLASYIAQSKGFSYHLLPTQVYATVTVCAVGYGVVGTLRHLSRHPRWIQVNAVVFAGVLVVSAAFAGDSVVRSARNFARSLETPYSGPVVQIAKIVEDQSAGDPFYVLSTSTYPSFPITNLAGARWPYHYNCLWPIPALYPGPGPIQYRPPSAQSALERQFFETVVNDLVSHPPRLLGVDRRRAMQAMRGRQFDYIQYFSASPAFAELFRRYRRVGQIGEWEFYERQF